MPVSLGQFGRLYLVKALASVFLLSFVFLPCLSLHAQYNAGNNGGGWVQQQRPGGPAPPPYDGMGEPWDWTGLDVNDSWVDSNGNSHTWHGKASSGYNIGGLGQIVVGPGYNQSFSISVSGKSTYEWLWSPPGGDVVINPAPALYGLGKVAFNQIAASVNGTDGGVTGYAFVSDGFGLLSGFSVPGSLSAYLLSHPRYQIIGPAAADGANVKFTLSPSLTASMAQGPGRDLGGLGGWFTEAAYPLVLSSPNPFGHPELGDGTNQFVYSADTPDGYLYVRGEMQVAGGTSAEANWLIFNNPIVTNSDMIDLRIENPVIPNTFTHQWVVNNNAIDVTTPNNSYPGYQANTWIYKGLPSDNSGFGNHDVNLYVRNNKSQSAKIQTFFNATAHNYPGAPGDLFAPYYIPNWYYYYNQAYGSPGTYQAGNGSYCKGSGTFSIW